MVGGLLGGEAFVSSLMDVIGRAPAQSLGYSPRGVHPTPYLRTFLSCELLRRMGFAERAREFRRAWSQLYPSPRASTLPPKLLAIGEVGLNGEIRAVSNLEARLKEAAKLGFELAIVPEHNLGGVPLPPGLKVVGVTRLMDAILKAVGADARPPQPAQPAEATHR